MPKKVKKEEKLNEYITIGVNKSFKEQLEKEAEELDISVSKLVRKKFFSENQTKEVSE